MVKLRSWHIVALGMMGFCQAASAQTTSDTLNSPQTLYTETDSETLPSKKVDDAETNARTIADTNDSTSEQLSLSLLQTLAPGTAGTLDETQGGYPLNLWSNSDIASVLDAWNELSIIKSSRVTNLIERRLAASAAVPPTSTAQGTTNDTAQTLTSEHAFKQTQFFEFRVQRLWQLGYLDDVIAMARNTPDQTSQQTIKSLEIQALLAKDDAEQACKALAEDTLDILHLQLARLTCDILLDRIYDMELTLALIAESPLIETPDGRAITSMALAAIYNDTSYADIEIPETGVLRSVLLALQRRAGLPMRLQGSLAQQNGADLQILAINPANNIGQRRQAVQILFDRGIWQATQIADWLNNIPADHEDATLGYWQKLLDRNTPIGDIINVWNETQSITKKREIAEFALPIIQTQDYTLNPQAIDIAQMLLLSGDNDTAQTWLQYINDNAVQYPDAQTRLPLVWPWQMASNWREHHVAHDYATHWQNWRAAAINNGHTWQRARWFDVLHGLLSVQIPPEPDWPDWRPATMMVQQVLPQYVLSDLRLLGDSEQIGLYLLKFSQIFAQTNIANMDPAILRQLLNSFITLQLDDEANRLLRNQLVADLFPIATP